jgi:tetratricopeptide (TPR) repeat protein
MEKKDYAKAIKDASDAVRINPKYTVGFDIRAAAYVSLGDFDKALLDLNEAIRLSSNYTVARNRRALVFELQGDLDKALADYNVAIRLDPKKPEQLLARAGVWRKKGVPNKAIEDYDEAVRLDPQLVDAYYQRGKVHFSKARDDLAIADFTAALKLNPNHALAHHDRALCHEFRNELDKALVGYDAAIALNPNAAESFRGRGDVRRKQGALDKALEAYTEALRLDPEFVQVRVERGKLRAGRRAFAEALVDFNEALRLAPQHVEGLFQRGQTWFGLGDGVKAVADYEQVLQLDSAHARAMNALAWLGAAWPDDKVRNGKKAVSLAVKACELTDWKNYEYVDTLAAAHAEIGDFDAAVKHQTRAVELAPAAKRGEFTERLELFKARKSYRLPISAKSVPLGEADTQKLFNGVDLQGWTIFIDPKWRKTDPASVWSVKNGEIYCNGNAPGYLVTKEEYGDYVLGVEWKWGPTRPVSGNHIASISTHVTGPAKTYPKAIEVRLRIGNAGPGDLLLWYGFKLRGDETRRNTQSYIPHYDSMIKSGLENPFGEWNKCVITCKGDTIKVEVNGKLVNEGTGAEISRGKILLSTGRTEVFFRNVTLRSLKSGR